MNKIDQLANEKFGGDLQKTAEYIFSTFSQEDQEKYVADITQHQAKEFVKYFKNGFKEKGINIQKIVDEQYDLASMELSKEEVINMENNPFKAKIGKDILKFVILNSGLCALYLVSSKIDKGVADTLLSAGIGITSILNTMFSFDTVKDALNYFKFRKLKKQYNEEMSLQDSGRRL